MQHIHSHGQDVGNECADHTAALGAFGHISNQNIRTRWVHSSFDSTTLFDACGNFDEILHVLRNTRITHMLVPQFQIRR